MGIKLSLHGVAKGSPTNGTDRAEAPVGVREGQPNSPRDEYVTATLSHDNRCVPQGPPCWTHVSQTQAS
jgi:hypothetical protein